MPIIQPPATFSGLASNIDTTGIINKLMKLERLPEQNLDRNIAAVNTRKAAWMNVNGALLNLKTSADSLKDTSLWTTVTAVSSDQTALDATTATGATAATYIMTISQLAKAESDISASYGSRTSALNLTGTFNITVAGTTKSVTVASTDTLDNIRDNINKAGAGVTASVVSTAPGSFSLLVQSNSTGTANAITYADDATNHTLKGLGLLTGAGANNVAQVALDAKFTLGGLNFTRSSNTVTDAVTGVTLNLKGTDTTGFTLTVQPDSATIISKIQDFVSKYNATHATIAKLTDVKATLQGDATLNGIANQLASLSYSVVPGLASQNSLSAIGISLQRDGTLAVDSGKLAAAVNGNLAGVKALFSTSGTGVAVQFSSYLDGLTSDTGTINGLSKSFDLQVQDLQRQRQLMETALSIREKTLKAEFTNMEQIVSRFQAQGNWLSSQLSSLLGSGSGGTVSGSAR